MVMEKMEPKVEILYLTIKLLVVVGMVEEVMTVDRTEMGDVEDLVVGAVMMGMG